MPQKIDAGSSQNFMSRWLYFVIQLKFNIRINRPKFYMKISNLNGDNFNQLELNLTAFIFKIYSLITLKALNKIGC